MTHNVMFSPENDPVIKEQVVHAFNEYLSALAATAQRLPKGGHYSIYKVSNAAGIHGIVGTIMVMAFRRDGRFWGIFRFEDGKILPGDDLGPENFRPLN